jgi:hypothetical protein
MYDFFLFSILAATAAGTAAAVGKFPVHVTTPDHKISLSYSNKCVRACVRAFTFKKYH